MSAGETLAPIGEGLWGTVFGVAPDIEPSDAPVEVRVVVVGRFVLRGSPTGEEVGAFVDVEILPQVVPTPEQQGHCSHCPALPRSG